MNVVGLAIDGVATEGVRAGELQFAADRVVDGTACFNGGVARKGCVLDGDGGNLFRGFGYVALVLVEDGSAPKSLVVFERGAGDRDAGGVRLVLE